MKPHASGMWWVMAIVTMRAIFLPTASVVHESDQVLHISSRLPDLLIRERML